MNSHLLLGFLHSWLEGEENTVVDQLLKILDDVHKEAFDKAIFPELEYHFLKNFLEVLEEFYREIKENKKVDEKILMGVETILHELKKRKFMGIGEAIELAGEPPLMSLFWKMDISLRVIRKIKKVLEVLEKVKDLEVIRKHIEQLESRLKAEEKEFEETRITLMNKLETLILLIKGRLEEKDITTLEEKVEEMLEAEKRVWKLLIEYTVEQIEKNRDNLPKRVESLLKVLEVLDDANKIAEFLRDPADLYICLLETYCRKHMEDQELWSIPLGFLSVCGEKEKFSSASCRLIRVKDEHKYYITAPYQAEGFDPVYPPDIEEEAEAIAIEVVVDAVWNALKELLGDSQSPAVITTALLTAGYMKKENLIKPLIEKAKEKGAEGTASVIFEATRKLAEELNSKKNNPKELAEFLKGIVEAL